jgi:hypothetical protein
VAQESADAGYALAFDEGKRAVAEQAATLKDTRDRVGTLISAAAVTAGLAVALGGGDAKHAGAWSVVGAIIAGFGFVWITVASVAIWWPFAGGFVLDPAIVVEDYVERNPTVSATHRALAMVLSGHITRNNDRLATRLRWFTVALVAFLLEIAGLLIVLIDLAR